MLARKTTPNDPNASHAEGTCTYSSRATSPWVASGGTTNRASTPATVRPATDAQPRMRWAPRLPALARAVCRIFTTDLQVRQVLASATDVVRLTGTAGTGRGRSPRPV